ADIAGDLLLEDLGRAHVLVELGLLGQPLPLRPGGLELAGGRDRAPFALRHDAEEIALAHDLDETGHVLDRGLVYAFERRADRRRAYDPAMQHAGYAEVLDIGEAASDFVGDVDARHRPAHDGVGRRVLGLRRLGVVELEREGLVADQLRIRSPPVAGAGA